MFCPDNIPADFTPLTDSRSLTDASHTIFFALRTATGDGHRFIPELYRRGVRAFVVDNNFTDSPEEFPGATFYNVESPLAALQACARQKREQFSGKVIAITGSYGKTMVKEWLCSLMSPEWSICRSPRSYNSQIGVPLSVWRLSNNNNLGIFEAGISRNNEMATLADIIQPDIVVITNIGQEHDEGFSSRQEKIKEKLLLARNASTIIYPNDNPELANILRATYPEKNLVGWDSSTFSAESNDVKFNSQWEVANAMTSMVVMDVMGYDKATISSRIKHLQPVGTRLQVSDGVNNSLIIQDDYTCDLYSLEMALDFTNQRQTNSRQLTVILSDIDNVATNSYRKAGELLRMHNINRVIGIGKEICAHFNELNIPGNCYPTTENFLSETTPSDFSDEVILVKGSPDFNFQRIVNRLEAKTHETVLEVNLDAMVDNFNFFRSKLKPTTKMVAMVKASGYGAGSLELAKTLQAHGAAYLAVAVGDEGAELRRAGITMPIMVLNPMVLNYNQLFSNHLEPEIFSTESLQAIIYEAKRAGITDYPIHLKLDTGMHRLGFREEELPALLKLLDSQNSVKVKSVFSHLATADCLDQDAYTLAQLEYYSRCSQTIVDHFPHKILRHVLNTAGILRFPQYQFDMVRLGIGLYGIPILNNGMEAPLRPISSLRSMIIAIHPWEQTETIGYGRHGVLKRKSLVATVPIGYADGFNRHCGRGNWKVAVNGHLCPTLGNICMDLCMIDVTDVPDVRIGDSVMIFGPENPVTAMAEVLDTIPYECLTSVSPRVRRVYYRES